MTDTDDARAEAVRIIDSSVPDDVPGYRIRYAEKAADVLIERGLLAASRAVPSGATGQGFCTPGCDDGCDGGHAAVPSDRTATTEDVQQAGEVIFDALTGDHEDIALADCLGAAEALALAGRLSPSDHTATVADPRVLVAEAWAAGRAETTAERPFIDIVFDGPPSHESGRFVKVEDEHGRSVNAGEWIDRGDGLWALRIIRAETTSLERRVGWEGATIGPEAVPSDHTATTEDAARALYEGISINDLWLNWKQYQRGDEWFAFTEGARAGIEAAAGLFATARPETTTEWGVRADTGEVFPTTQGIAAATSRDGLWPAVHREVTAWTEAT